MYLHAAQLKKFRTVDIASNMSLSLVRFIPFLKLQYLKLQYLKLQVHI